MSDTPLTPDLLQNPDYCHLGMRIGADSLTVMIYNPLEDNSLIVRQFPIPTEGDERQKAIESIVYDNPLLLLDFAKTNVEIESANFLLIPEEVTDEAEIRKLFNIAHPETETRDLLIDNPLEGLNARAISAIRETELNFIRRTIGNVAIFSHLVPLIKYLRQQLHHGNTTKAFINVREFSADVIVLSHDRLYLANRFAYKEPSDLIYYILAATTPPGGYEVNETLVTGNRPRRDQIIKGLREFRSSVMPMIFPSEMYRAGRVSLSSPFDLIILPLCE